jgi:GAF domain-containing protein/anti-sigma regulatory factor (Ser/Thr protein kinase)
MPSETSTTSADQSVDELRRELAEAREQQAATAEILRVISSSPLDLRRVFAEIAASAARLCDAYDAAIGHMVGNELHLVAHHGPIPTTPVAPLMRGALPGRAVLDRQTFHIPDMQAETNEYPEGSERARRLGFRTTLVVPLIRGGEAIGTISIRRTEVRPFTDRQIELLKTFADQAVIAIENTRLFEAEEARTKEVEAKSAELRESLEYQTATSEVLSVISRSPNDVKPVLDTIARIAQRLCEAEHAFVLQREEEGYRLVAANDALPDWVSAIKANPLLPGRGTLTGRVALERRTVHVDDLRADPEYTLGPTLQHGVRSELGVPLMRDGEVIGVIIVGRTEVRPFTKRQIALVETFADQAVIAIENTRLFNEVQTRNRELGAALEQQTATADVLGAISRSKFDLQPVLDTLVSTAARLCDAQMVAIHIRHDNAFPGRARYGVPAEMVGALSRISQVMGRGSLVGRTIAEGRPVHIPDAAADPEYTNRDFTRITGARSMLGVPLMRDGRPVGLLSLYRTRVAPFTPKQIELMATFADQAVIAIENTRLFEEVQARTRELTESLEQQTAASEVLEVISRSPGDLAQVFNIMLASATRICKANFGNMYLRDGELFRLTAAHNTPPALLEHRKRVPLQRPTSVFGRMVSSKTLVHVADLMAEPTYAEGEPEVVSGVELGGIRTILMVPMLKEDQFIGALTLYRQEVRPFSEKQIELVANFARQAVIAIENTRLLNELRESLQQQTATADVLKVISRSAFDLQTVLDTLVEAVARLCGAKQAVLRRRENDRYPLAATYGIKPEWRELIAGHRNTPGRGTLVGRVAVEKRTLQIPDVFGDPEFPNRETAKIVGFRSIIGTPLLRDGEQIGFISLHKETIGPFTAKQIQLLENFADQAVIAIENTRLFEEVEARTRELAKTVEDLEIASQHKSQFVANMSHELRTPLAAILGYAELIQEGFYESQGPKSLDALTRIRSNGKHLLGLINTVLDIAKIESGQFTLNMAEYAIESVVETVRSATESLAQNKKLALKTEVAKSLPIGLGDEQRLTQVLLNLVGNAIKFTDSGEVCVSAKAVNGHFNVSVTDTGPGIPEDHQMRIFEQFHQVDSSNTKAKGGTGLGLAIAKQIVEMHGGRIWVESTLGQGSTFQMELPTRAELRKPAS